jgi:hypothetical protein
VQPIVPPGGLCFVGLCFIFHLAGSFSGLWVCGSHRFQVRQGVVGTDSGFEQSISEKRTKILTFNHHTPARAGVVPELLVLSFCLFRELFPGIVFHSVALRLVVHMSFKLGGGVCHWLWVQIMKY